MQPHIANNSMYDQSHMYMQSVSYITSYSYVATCMYIEFSYRMVYDIILDFTTFLLYPLMFILEEIH